MRDISIIIPTYNEEKILSKNLRAIYRGISKRFPNRCKFIIIDSNSTDKTASISKKFSRNYEGVSYINLDCVGKGCKIINVALKCNTSYAGWIDSDIPLKMEEYYKIMNRVIVNNADLAISSRYAKGAKIKRRITRLIGSMIFHTLVKMLFMMGVTDTTCGAKFWNAKVAKNVWPKVKGQKWFFDTELVYYCIKRGYKVVEVPITYKDRRDSRLSILKDSHKLFHDLVKFKIRTLFLK